MKKGLIVLLVLLGLCLFVIPVSAEVLLTANTLGQGRFGIKTSYINSTNSYSSALNTTGYGLIMGYGIIPDLDIYSVAGYQNYSNINSAMPPGYSYTVNGPQYGALLKYRFMADSENVPLNLSGIVAYKVNNLTAKMSSTYSGETSGNTMIEDWGSGMVLSKAISNVVPYMATLYHVGSWIDAYGAIHTTGLEFVAGMNLLFSESTGVIMEYSSNAVVALNSSASPQTISNISFSLGHRL